MQMITSRQNRLLKFLLPRREYVTLMKIAEYLNVSEKTVQRDLRFLEQWLSEWKMTIDKRSGAGVMLIADNVTDLLQLDQLLGNEGEDSDVMMNNSRRVKIASQLLSETPRETSINKLSERYFISSASIVNDLKIIESWIAPLGLTLIRSQSGTHIEGSENSVRQAMASLINGVINHNEPGCIIHSRLDSGSYKALVHYFGEDDVLFVQSLLQEMERKLCWSLGEPYYVNIFTHILIMMYRITRGNALPRREQGQQIFDETIFSVAQNMLRKIEHRIDHSLPEDEVWFIYQYIISSGVVVEERDDVSMVRYMHSSDEARQITDRLISAFSTMIDLDLTADRALYDGLLIHIKPLINRLNFRIYIRNPLLEDIKGELFPDWTIVGVVSASSLHTLQPQDKIELVISTINLPEIALPVVYVSAFFNDADIRRVTEKIVTDKLHRAAISAVDNEVLYP